MTTICKMSFTKICSHRFSIVYLNIFLCHFVSVSPEARQCWCCVQRSHAGILPILLGLHGPPPFQLYCIAPTCICDAQRATVYPQNLLLCVYFIQIFSVCLHHKPHQGETQVSVCFCHGRKLDFNICFLVKSDICFTLFRSSLVWTAGEDSPFSVSPSSCDLPPLKSTSFRVTYHPKQLSTLHGAQLECFAYYKVRLFDNQGMSFFFEKTAHMFVHSKCVILSTEKDKGHM